jgi:hypothetical protein
MAQRPFARIRMSALTSSHLAAYRDERLKVVSGGRRASRCLFPRRA